MGNCITFQRVVSWVDDGEWDFLEPDDDSPQHYGTQTQSPEVVQEEHPSTSNKSTDQDQFLIKPSPESSTKPSTKPSTHEVRIKITKKQLSEMLRQAESKGLPVQDVLASLIETAKPHRVKHRIIGQCWRPGLQSIPEIVE